MSFSGDNPFDDGLDFIGCLPEKTEIKLPEFPEDFKGDCRLIHWVRCLSVPKSQRRMWVKIEKFRPSLTQCGVYLGYVTFIDVEKKSEWYGGELKFYYTRNYLPSKKIDPEKKPLIVFRFVAKGDLKPLSDDIPEKEGFPCTQRMSETKYDKEVFVYGGLDLLIDVERGELKTFMLSLGHNDGWYTHHPECSERPIKWEGSGDFIGHYSDEGWLFVSPGWNFRFNNGLWAPSKRFNEEALRKIGEECYTEEAIRYGYLKTEGKKCIHEYQKLEGWAYCRTHFESTESCQGFHYSDKKHDFLTFFSMGYWFDRLRRVRIELHLVEGNIGFRGVGEDLQRAYYFYGFSTQNIYEDLKLVDLVDNGSLMGAPGESRLLLYLYNAGEKGFNPIERFVPIDPKLSLELLEFESTFEKKKIPCLLK